MSTIDINTILFLWKDDILRESVFCLESEVSDTEPRFIAPATVASNNSWRVGNTEH